MFEDDTNICASAESVDEFGAKLNSDLSNIYQWLVANKLILNISKTEYRIIGSRYSLTVRLSIHPTIKIGGESIIDDQLKWQDRTTSAKKFQAE
jgi:hypothetical protein